MLPFFSPGAEVVIDPTLIDAQRLAAPYLAAREADVVVRVIDADAGPGARIVAAAANGREIRGVTAPGGVVWNPDRARAVLAKVWGYGQVRTRGAAEVARTLTALLPEPLQLVDGEALAQIRGRYVDATPPAESTSNGRPTVAWTVTDGRSTWWLRATFQDDGRVDLDRRVLSEDD